MEDEVKYQREEDIKVMVVLRLRYRKPVNPSCDIVEMSWNVWREFLRSSHKDRLKIALRILNRPFFAEYIEELLWIPLGKQNKLQIIDENDIIRV
jgi:hypothetical protein